MKQNIGWILFGVALAVILYLVFRPVPTPDNSRELSQISDLTKDNNLLKSSLNAQFNNFRTYRDSSGRVIDSLKGRNQAIKITLSNSQRNERDLAQQILGAQNQEPLDSPCIELAKKVLSDSVTIISYQKNTDRLIHSFEDAVNQRDSLISIQSKVILSDSVLIASQKGLTDKQTKQLKNMTSRAKTSAWIARSLMVVSAVLAGILLSK